MAAGEAVIGTLHMSYSPELVEILAYVGFDFVFVDQMFTSIGWTELTNMVRLRRVRKWPFSHASKTIRGLPRVWRVLGIVRMASR